MNGGHLGRVARTALVSALALVAGALALVPWRALTSDAGQVVEPALVAGAVLWASGTALRACRVPAVVVGLTQLAVATTTTIALVTGRPPTPGAVDDLTAALRSAGEAAALFPPPVPEAGGGIGALLAVAVVATLWLCDVLAADLRAAPAVGLPLLAVFSLPVTILLDTPDLVFSLASGLAYLALLAAHEHDGLHHWGRTRRAAPLRASLRVPVATPVAAAAALASAVLVATLVPVLDLGLLDRVARGGPAAGSVVVGEPGANLQGDLQRGEDVPLLELGSTSDAVGTPGYLRLGVLPEFDDDAQAWVSGDLTERPLADGLVPPEGYATGDRTFDWVAEATDDLASTWLPLLDDVLSLEADGGWRYRPDAGDLTREDDTTAGRTWTFRSAQSSITSTDLAAADGPVDLPEVYTEAPEVSEAVSELAAEVTSDADSDYERAVALQTFFRDTTEFTYDLSVSAEGDDALEEFLLDTRAGFCQHFAAAMAVMARDLGMPSRVVVGFLQPRLVSPGRWEFSAHDLHAWPELYFPGSGWVRFEPTPGQRAATVPSYTAPRAEEPTTPSPTSGATSGAPTSRPPSSAPTSDGATPSTAPEADGSTGGSSAERGGGVLVVLGALALAALLAALLVLPGLLREGRRRRRLAGSAEDAWEELRAALLDHGVRWPEGLSPAATARALVDDWTGEVADGVPDAALDLVERLVTAVETERYADRAAPPLGDVVPRIVAARVEHLPARRRLRARWLPRSARGRRAAGADPVVRDLEDEAVH